MKCERCQQPATIHLTEARGQAAVGERHLCDDDARTYLQAHPVYKQAGPGRRGPAGAAREVPCEIVFLIISEVHDQQVVVLREEAGGRVLPLVVGILEATALDRRLKGMASPRPLTHDGWAGTILALGGQVRDVILHELCEQTYHAQVRIVQTGRLVAVDVRPSDAFTLAVTCRRPILVAEQLLDQAAGL